MTHVLFNLDDLKQKLARPCISFEIGGFRPPDDPLASWFGRVNVCAKGEAWPETGKKPMHALCQINLTVLPFRPLRLDDIAFITVFIGPNELPDNDVNGASWCLRAYKSTDALIPLAQRETGTGMKSFPMRAQTAQTDFPCWEDVPIKLPEEIEEKYHDLFENLSGFKLGGWPTLVQSEIHWSAGNKHPAKPEFVFQIDSTEKGNWAWGDGGVGYFGRGTAPGKEDEWTIEWQCY